MAGSPLPLPYGNVRDPGSFFSALVPKQRTAVTPKALVPLVDTVLLVRGRPVRWLCNGSGGEATEKLSTDREAMLRVFKEAGACVAWAWRRAVSPRRVPRAFSAAVSASVPRSTPFSLSPKTPRAPRHRPQE
jgi:hypothetical protein